MRRVLVAALAASSLLAVGGGTALADGHDGTTPVVNPLPTRVVDEGSANTFAQAYVIRNGARIAGVDLGDRDRRNGRDDRNGRNDRNRVRVTVSDAASACLQHPVVLTRFGCIVRFNVAVTEERGRDRTYSRGHDRNPPVVNPLVRNIGCLAALRINGGPSVTPSVSVAFADCVQRRSVRTY
jgi:hypothetical protein